MVSKQKHDLGVQKRLTNAKNNPKPLSKEARVAKRRKERLASQPRRTEDTKGPRESLKHTREVWRGLSNLESAGSRWDTA